MQLLIKFELLHFSFSTRNIVLPLAPSEDEESDTNELSGLLVILSGELTGMRVEGLVLVERLIVFRRVKI